jgi:hypothetical protein
MITRYALLFTGAFLATIALQSESAHALSMQECSAKYKAVKDAGTLNGMKWNDFRKAQCGAEAAAAPPTPAARPATTAAPSAATGNAIFPSAVLPKYSSESAEKARMHTCLDQYRVNKARGMSFRNCEHHSAPEHSDLPLIRSAGVAGNLLHQSLLLLPSLDCDAVGENVVVNGKDIFRADADHLRVSVVAAVFSVGTAACRLLAAHPSKSTLAQHQSLRSYLR